jgi:excisionase family DNA binding protein
VAHPRDLAAIKADYDRLISPQAAASRLSVDKRTIRRRIADGVLPAYTVAGTRTVRVRESDVEALLQPVPTVDGAA